MSLTSSGSCDEVYQLQEDIGQVCKLVCIDVMWDQMARIWSAVDWRGRENQGQVGKGQGALV